MVRSMILAAAMGLGLAVFTPAPPAEAQVYYRDRATGQWVYDAQPYKPRKARGAQVASGPVAVQRSCRRQVRRSLGAIPGVRMRMPRSYPQLIDRCIANGGVYS